MSIDSVSKAEETPDQAQPFAELGLKTDEYERIREILKRRPTSSELAMYSVMWSEHCSYKNSIIWLKKLPKSSPKMLAEAGEENAMDCHSIPNFNDITAEQYYNETYNW